MELCELRRSLISRDGLASEVTIFGFPADVRRGAHPIVPYRQHANTMLSRTDKNRVHGDEFRSNVRL